MWKGLATRSQLSTMAPMILFLLSSLFAHSLFLKVEPAKPSNSHITVMGIVYCDICSNNTFSKNSYFLPGVEVKIECKFQAISPRTTEQISASVKRTTDKFGVYRVEIPSVEGIECGRDSAIDSSCQATLLQSSSSSCNVPGHITTTDEIEIKSKRNNVCIYSLDALSYRPSERDTALCGN